MTQNGDPSKAQGDTADSVYIGRLGGLVEGIWRSAEHTMHKFTEESITLIEGFGVEGDAHGGATVKHRVLVKRDPTAPNLRQVHLMPAEWHEELRAMGFSVQAGEMGENITTRGLDLLSLPPGTLLRLGAEAVIEVTGLRNPCPQLDGIEAGLMQ